MSILGVGPFVFDTTFQQWSRHHGRRVFGARDFHVKAARRLSSFVGIDITTFRTTTTTTTYRGRQC